MRVSVSLPLCLFLDGTVYLRLHFFLLQLAYARRQLISNDAQRLPITR